MGELSRGLDAELAERRARLTRHEDRIRGIITMQIDGDRSPYVQQMREDFEAQARTERAAIAALEAQASMPLRLPSPQELAEDRILDLDALCSAEGDDVEPAREQLRRLLKGGHILCAPEDGVYVARCELLPLEALLGHKPETPAESNGRCPHVVARGRFYRCTTTRCSTKSLKT
ncbi:MAG TPA: hypothetical protein ENK57_26605 [Polyangiaceae bacterium]|nr:hypothetical protein [Polyangiaceae bacterium]